MGTTTFKYDPFGRRIQKSGPLGTTNYLYDSWDLIEEADNSGNVLARYIDGVGFDQPLSMLRSGTASFSSDLLGSITSLSNSSGVLASTYSYDAFGKLSASTGTLVNPFQFTGREFDPETGIPEYRMRYYDQNVGRFISEDPINFRGGIDFYAYTLNNPVNWIDPFGLEVQECRRPIKVPGASTPHTFLYSTESGTGYGLGPASGWGLLLMVRTCAREYRERLSLRSERKAETKLLMPEGLRQSVLREVRQPQIARCNEAPAWLLAWTLPVRHMGERY